TADQTGRASGWTPFGGNPESATDFATSIPTPPAPPTVLGQFQSDGTTAIPPGDTALSRSVVFTAVVSDANPGDQVRLEVEVQRTATAFTGVATGSGASVASGATATATIAGLSDNTAYHWQARAVDQTGRASGWVPFGGNAESDTDFVVAVAATRLVFTVQPGTTTAGSPITPAVQVTALDVFGNPVTSFAGSVTVAIARNPGGGTLSGATTAAAVSGVASFGNLTVNRTGSGYALTARTAGLAGGTSNPFDITSAAPARLVFSVQPTNTAAGAAITPAVQVTVQDGLGNTATSYTGNVVIAIGSNPGGGTLSGTATVAAASGVASFPGLSINRSGAGYTIGASSASLTGTTSTAFTVTPGTATRVAFTVQPTGITAGSVITPAVQVT